MIILAILAVFSVLLAAWQWVATFRFPLHQRIPRPSFSPDITILKPLKGLDHHLPDCLRTWLNQDYPGKIQVIFGVADPADPACAAIRDLIAEFPHRDLQLLPCPESLGINGKVSSLIQMLRQAKHEVIIVSDSDVSVARDFLANVVDPLRDPAVGLVNCFYRFANPVGFAMRCEALAVNADFWSQVLQGRSLQPQDFALGAVMITRRADLKQNGGFESLADYLADDFQLGNRMVRIAQKKIELCPVVVDCISPPVTAREVWAHQVRWARTIRASKPAPYAASILSNATLWPLLWAIAQPGKWSLALLGVSILFRMVMAWNLQQRLGPVPGQAAFFWLPPFKDLLQFALWLAAFGGRHVIWRGQRLRLLPDGRLEPATAPAPRPLS